MYLLDTNACIRFLNGRSPSLRDRLLSQSRQEICVCSVTKAELYFGAYRSNRVAENIRSLQSFLNPVKSFAFDDSCVDTYGRIRADLQRQGTPIGNNDLLIAAIALTNSLTLVTANTREFARVTGLQLENWELP